MKKQFILLLIGTLSLHLYSQQRENESSLTSGGSSINQIYLSLGGGASIGKTGGIFGPFGFSGTLIPKRGLGFSISLRGIVFTAINTPHDHKSFLFSPTDVISITSAMFVIESPGRGPGLELGPALVGYNETKFTLNPEYGGTCFFICPPKYLTDHERSNPSFGFSLRAKYEFLDLEHFGLELATFININKHNPFFGLEFNLAAGRVKTQSRSR